MMSTIVETTATEAPAGTLNADDCDVFISYSRRNDDVKEWVHKQLVPRLVAAGLSINIDEHWLAGASIPDSIEKGIQNARRTLVVLTSEWLTSEWCALERRIILLLDPAASQRRLVPILRDDCIDQLPASIKSLAYYDLRGDIEEDAWQHLLESLRADKAAERGLKALATLMKRNPQVLRAVIETKAALTGVLEKIQALTACKELHDCFQRLEDPHKLLSSDAKNLSDDPRMWESIERNEALSFRGPLRDVMEAARHPALADDEAFCVASMECNEECLRRSIEDRNAEECRNALQEFGSILNREPARINTKLFDEAHELRLGQLVSALSNIDAELAALGLNAEEARERADFSKSIRVMEQCSITLDTYVNCHNILQRMWDELNAKDPYRFQDVRQFESAWMYQENGLKLLDQLEHLECLDPLKVQSEAIRQELRFTRNLSRLRSRYLDYQGSASRVFNQVNVFLKGFLRTEVKPLGQSLAEILEKMQHD